MKGKITLVTGGARSGKSTYAEQLAKTSIKPVAYMATAIPFDEGMKDRIKKHQETRPKEWTTFEGYKDLYKQIHGISKNHKTILLDCVTVMVTNLMLEDPNIDWDQISSSQRDELEMKIKNQIIKLIKEVRKNDIWIIMVSNEVGMGIVPDNRLASIFRDIAGRMNQLIARESDDVYFTVSGIPMKMK